MKNRIAILYTSGEEIKIDVSDNAQKIIDQGRIDKNIIVSHITSIGNTELRSIRKDNRDAIIKSASFPYIIMFDYIDETITVKSIISKKEIINNE